MRWLQTSPRSLPYTGRNPRRRRTGDLRKRKLAFEELEDRRLLATDFAQIANLLNNHLLTMQSQVTAGLNGYDSGAYSSVPIVGSSLGSASQVVNRFNTQLHSALAGLGTVASFTDADIQNALAVVPFLADRNGDGIGANDVLVSRPGGLGSDGFAVQMRLHAAQSAASTAISFDTGLPGLPFSVTGNGVLDVSAGFAYELAFTYNSTTQQVALDSTKTLGTGPAVTAPSANHPLADLNHPLAIFVSAEPSSGFNAEATIGFVQGTAAPLAGQANGLYVTTMVNGLDGAPTFKLDGAADANLQLTGSFAGTGNDFPGIDADFHLHWALSSSNPGASAPEVVFDNVHLNLGKFISNVVGPVFEAIQDATDPLGPVLEVLDYPLPGVSDLSRLVGGDNMSLLDLGGVVAPFTGFGPLYDLVHQAIDITNQIRDLDIAETVRMPLGGFDLDTYDLRSVAPAGSLANLNLPNLTSLTLSAENLRALGQTFNQIVAGLDVDEDVKTMLGELTAGLDNGFDIRFPILDKPQDAVFGLLLGRDSDLFTLDAEADFDAQGSLATGFSVFGLGVSFDGEVSIDTKFKFAYDTYGLRVLMNNLAQGNTSNIADDILDGFYIAADSHFDIGGRISAGVGASVGIFSATVGGFVSTDDNGNDPVSITITDPNSDGKLRFAEFQANPFNMSGRLSAALGIEVAVGYDPPVGPFIGWRERFDVANVVIVDLDNPPEPGPPPIILASQPDENGTIVLYIGEDAHLRSGPGVSQTNGSEQIIVRNIKTTGDSETVEIALRQEDGGNEYWVRQEIAGVKWIHGTGDVGNLVIDVLEGVNVNVNFTGGQGTTDLRYHGTGSAHLQAGQQAAYLSGGQGGNTLLGGPANDTIVLGPGSNLVTGGLGDNMIVLSAPYTQSGLVFGGSDPAAHNTAVVLSGDDRWRHLPLQPPDEIRALPGNEDSIELNYRPAGSGTFSPSVFLSGFKTLSISGEDRATDITVGDLSSAGVTQVFVNIPDSGGGGRDIDLATRATGGATQITLDPFVHTYPDPWNPPAVVLRDEMQLINTTTGVTTYLFGTTAGDVTTIHHHGGSIQIGQLAEDAGTIFFDIATRQPDVANTVTMTTPVVTLGNQISSYANGLGQFVVDAVNYPTLVFHGLAPIDSMMIGIAAPGSFAGTNDVDIDASVLRGSLILNALGDATAKNDITLSHVGSLGDVAIHGGSTTSSLLLGTGQLAAIKTNVTASNVQLSIDNSAALLGSLLALTASTFGDWLLPDSGTTPQLNFSGLRGAMEIFAGAGDRFQLDVTPAGVTSLTMHNASSTLDPVYTANWMVPLMLLGNFAFYAGQRLNTSGTVERVKRLINIAVPVTLAFSGSEATEVVLDGDLDAPAQYTINGSGDLHVYNQTVGLDVTITGFRSQDELYIYMPGASVAANLQRTSAGTIYFDSTARMAGANPTAANSYTIEARYGQTELLPLAQYDSLLDMFNDVHLLGSLPQDSLTVNVPTHVRIAPSYENLPIQGGFAMVDAERTDSLIAWMAGARPAPFFAFDNVDAASWDIVWPISQPGATYPNPFVEFPYGVDVQYVDGPLTVHLGSESWSGIARYFISDPAPVPIDNDVRIDASQLRGSMQFNVTDPDYAYIQALMLNTFGHFPWSIWTVDGIGYVWYNDAHNGMRLGFGQSDIVLSHVNSELAVGVTGTSQFAYSPTTFGPNVRVTPYTQTSLDVGDGVLANIQGNVSAQKVTLTVDDSLGTSANNLLLTGSTLTGWATAGGTTQPVLTMAALGDRPLTLVGSATDRFGVENAPSTAASTTISNLATSGAHAPVYVMAKPGNRTLNVVGNFDLYIGRQLNADGSVTAVGQVAGVLPGATQPNPGAINYEFTGQGHGLLVYDAANHVAAEGDFGQMVITSHATDPTKGRLLFDHPNNLVVYGNDTDIDFYGPTIAAQSGNPAYVRTSLLVDHRLPGTIHYYAGPTTPNHRVRVMAAYAPVYIQGAGSKTRVELDPANFFAFSNMLVMSSPGDDLVTTIQAAVTVSNAHLTIRPDLASTPAPPQLKNIVMTASQLTGIAGGAINYSNLQDGTNFSTTIPGLIVNAPRHGAELTIQGTPAGNTTGIHRVGQSLGNVQVLGTNGRLTLGSLEQTGNFFVNSEGQVLNFSAQSLNIGNGNVQNIQGEILIGQTGTFSTTAGTIIDNRNDTQPRTVTISNGVVVLPGTPVIQGLAPAAIRSRKTVTGGISIYGSAGSQFTVSYPATGASLYAGAGSTVDLTAVSNQLSDLRILGAATVRQLATFLNSLTPATRIEADPARPNDVTNLIDYYVQGGNGVVLGNAGGGMYQLSDSVPYLVFAGDTTHVTLQSNGANVGFGLTVRIDDSPAAGAVIYPARQQVHVGGTTGSVEIHQGPEYFGSTVVLGNSGNMQSIHGAVTVYSDNLAVPGGVALTMNNSADGTSRTVTAAYPSTDHWVVTGLAPGAIHIIGDKISTSIAAGAGSNTLVGPNVNNAWRLDANNGGTLNGDIAYSGISNIVGGSLDDEFFFLQNGLVGGNLDGGPAFDILRYAPGVLNGSETIDLPNGVAPKVNGVVSNVEQLIVQQPLSLQPISDRSDRVGSPIAPLQIIASGGYGPITYGASGLPAGLTIDTNTGVISGTIQSSEILFSPFYIQVSAYDGVDQLFEDFLWTVLPPPPPTVAELNAGTPAGVPFLAAVLDPSEYPYPDEITAVAYPVGTGTQTIAYFRHNGRLWQTDGETASEVLSIDATDPTIDYPFSLIAIPGRGVVFSDGDHLWFANRDGARVILDGNFIPYADYAAVVGDSIVFASQQPGGVKLRQVSFDPSGLPITQVLTSDTNIVRQVAAFAGGVVYTAIFAGSPTTYVLKWVDPSIGVPVTLATSQTPFPGFPPSAFSDFVTTAGAGESENLYFFEMTSSGAQLRMVNSAELQSPTPQITTVATFASGVSVGSLDLWSQPMRGAGSRVVFSTATSVSDSTHFQFWISDGTSAGTVPVGSVFQDGIISEQTSFAGAVYFVHQPQNSFVDESTLVAQIWKVDPIAQQLTSVATYFGNNYVFDGPQYFVAAGDTLYFQSWEPSAQDERLWSLTADTAPALVPAQPNNPYAAPSLWDTAYVDGALYFNARSDAVLDQFGEGTYQLWVVGPAYAAVPELVGDYNGDQSADAADYVVWRKLLGTTGVPAYSGPDGDGDTTIDPDDYDVWSEHFGQTPPAGSGGTGSSAASSSGTATQPDLLQAPFVIEPVESPAATSAATARHAAFESLDFNSGTRSQTRNRTSIRSRLFEFGSDDHRLLLHEKLRADQRESRFILDQREVEKCFTIEEDCEDDADESLERAVVEWACLIDD